MLSELTVLVASGQMSRRTIVLFSNAAENSRIIRCSEVPALLILGKSPISTSTSADFTM